MRHRWAAATGSACDAQPKSSAWRPGGAFTERRPAPIEGWYLTTGQPCCPTVRGSCGVNTRAAAAVAAAAAAACELNEEPRLPTLPPAPSAHRRPAPIQAVLNPPAAWTQPATAGNTRSVCCPRPLGGIASQLAGTAACICNRRGMQSSWNQKWHRNVIEICWLTPGGRAIVWHSSAGLWPIRRGIPALALSSARCRRVPAGAAAAAARAVVAAAVHAARPLVGLGWSIPRGVAS